MDSKKAAFMGKITAGVTHEIKNVLAIIKESAGLMEDLIALSKENSIPEREKFIRSLSRIGDQVARGVDLSTRLNAFAHTPDEATSSLDLNSAVMHAAFLCRRFARLKGMTLEAGPGDGIIVVRTDPLGLQMLLFECIDLMMSVAPKDAAITILPTGSGGKRIDLAIAGEGGAANVSNERDVSGRPGWRNALEIAEGLGVAVETSGPPPRLAIRFP